MIEVWRDYIHDYQISNFGNIKNKRTGNILKQNIDKTGYLGVTVSLGSRAVKKRIKIHRAVAEAFLPNSEMFPVVNHIDGNPLNNNVNNLEWCTQEYNMRHAFKMGLATNEHTRRPIYCPELDISTISILEMSKYLIEHSLVESKDIANIHRNIGRVMRGDRKKYRGLTFVDARP